MHLNDDHARSPVEGGKFAPRPSLSISATRGGNDSCVAFYSQPVPAAPQAGTLAKGVTSILRTGGF